MLSMRTHILDLFYNFAQKNVLISYKDEEFPGDKPSILEIFSCNWPSLS